MPQPRKKRTKPYIVGLAQDLSEYAHVQVDATSSSEAEDIVSTFLAEGKLNKLDFSRGDYLGNPYTWATWEKEDDTAVDCIITNNSITFPPRNNTTPPPIETEITNPPYAVRPYHNDANIDAFEIIATTPHIADLEPLVVAVVAKYISGELIPHVYPEARTILQATAQFIAHACNAYQTAIVALANIANYGDLKNSDFRNHPLREFMLQLSGKDCAEIARTALDTINPSPSQPHGSQPEVESEEPDSYRIEIDRCPLYLSIEARSSSTAIANAITLVKELTQNENKGIALPLSQPGDHDADAIIYPSLDAKDYRVADVEPLH
jgi:hypothetical protein